MRVVDGKGASAVGERSRPYDELTGTLLWSHVEDAGGPDEVLTLGLAGDRLIAAAIDGCDDRFLSCSLATRTLDARFRCAALG
jgi:hypothetical protein